MLLIGCLKAKKSQVLFHDNSHIKKEAISEQFPYHSDTLPEDCLLCGNKSNTPLSSYWGEDNIGVIRLNTFNIAYIGINRYDNYGNRIEKPTRGSSIKITNTGENGFSFLVSEDTNRGFANGYLSLRQDEFLDLEKAASSLCTNCLNHTINSSWDKNPMGIGVINFSNREIQLFQENIAAFQFGDYYISCDSKRRKENSEFLEMDLLIFYCPNRYEK